VTIRETPNGKTSPPDLNFSGSSNNALAAPPTSSCYINLRRRDISVEAEKKSETLLNDTLQ
jgi:hypothetical protein